MNRELKAGDLLKVGRSERLVGVGERRVDKRRERVFGKPLRPYYGGFFGFKSLSRGGKEVEFLEEA